MLVLSLIVSGVLLLLVNVAVAGSKHREGYTVLFGIVATVAPVFIGVVLPTVALQAVLLCVALAVLCRYGRTWRTYLPASLAVTLVAYGATGWLAFQRQRELAEFRRQYPVESMDELLPSRPAGERPRPVVSDRLDRLEGELEYEGRPDVIRNLALRRLHEDQVGLFVNSPGFGVGRMLGVPTEETLHRGRRGGPPVPQPGPGPDRSPPDRWEPVAGSHFDSLHEASVLDFINPAGFGLIQDRTRVLGFQKHGFSKVPDPADTWKVGSIDLIGLLLHPEPAAYVSANLARMDELRDAPTRPLDPFEAEGLERLRGGEEMFVRGSDKQARMLGAVRSTKQCLACHGGDRGDLLGAFSYTLRRGE